MVLPIAVCVELDDKGRACALRIEEKTQRRDWAELAQGAYLLRTKCTEDDPSALWRLYIHLTQAEECFKISKSDLHLRPVFHQTTERVEAHILVCFLTLALWRTLEMWMKAKGLGDCARQLIKEVSAVRSMDVVLQARPRTPRRPSYDCASWPARTKWSRSCSRVSVLNCPMLPKSCRM